MSFLFTFLMLIVCVTARLASVGIFFVLRICKKKELSFQDLLVLWYSGSIRGAIAFALSLSIKQELVPNKSLIASTTLIIVLVTTLVGGGMMGLAVQLIGLKPKPENEEESNLINNAEVKNR